MNQSLAELYELQKVDSALDEAKRKFQALDQGKAEKAAAESAREIAERSSRSRDESAGDLKDAELEQQAVEKKRKDYETKLYSGKVTSPKELMDIQHEIEALGRQRGLLDERILTLMEQVETRKAEAEEAERNLSAVQAALSEKVAAYRTVGRELAVRIDTLTKRRAEMAPGIPAPLLKRYESIRAHKHGVGIAKLEGNSCDACKTSLPANLVRRATDTDSLELCENCGRILFVEN